MSVEITTKATKPTLVIKDDVKENLIVLDVNVINKISFHGKYIDFNYGTDNNVQVDYACLPDMDRNDIKSYFFDLFEEHHFIPLLQQGNFRLINLSRVIGIHLWKLHGIFRLEILFTNIPPVHLYEKNDLDSMIQMQEYFPHYDLSAIKAVRDITGEQA